MMAFWFSVSRSGLAALFRGESDFDKAVVPGFVNCAGKSPKTK